MSKSRLNPLGLTGRDIAIGAGAAVVAGVAGVAISHALSGAADSCDAGTCDADEGAGLLDGDDESDSEEPDLGSDFVDQQATTVTEAGESMPDVPTVTEGVPEWDSTPAPTETFAPETFVPDTDGTVG